MILFLLSIGNIYNLVLESLSCSIDAIVYFIDVSMDTIKKYHSVKQMLYYWDHEIEVLICNIRYSNTNNYLIKLQIFNSSKTICQTKCEYQICAFSFNRFEFFWEFLQENSYISASDGQILDQIPDLDRLLNSNIML